MTLIDSLYRQGLRALREPRAAAADVLQLGFPREALVPSLLLVAVLSVLLDALLTLAIPEAGISTSPFRALFFYLATAGAFSVLVTVIGKWFGGSGQMEDAFLLVIFLQALLVPATALQVVIALFSPQLAIFFMFAVAVFLIWVQVNFVAALHGFESLGRAFLVLLLTSVVVAFVAAPFLAPQMAGVSDV